jgi:hypothetical protein
MSYASILSALAEKELLETPMFELLREISKLVNNRSSEIQGRDLVIRALAHVDRCTDFEKSVLMALVRNVGLFPYMTDGLVHAQLDDFLAYELHRPENMPEVFHSLQAKIYYQLRAGSNVVLSASTSVGKSLLIDAMIALGKFRKIVIIVPTLALIDETRRRLARRFRGKVHIITHQSQVVAPEMINVYILTQERVIPRLDLSNVDFFVVDEFYKLDIRGSSGEEQRAVDLNLAFHKLAQTGAQFYLLGPNVHAIRGLDRYEVHFIPSEFTTVAVDVIQFNLPHRGDERPNKLIELCRTLSGPTLIYCQSPSSASRVAEALLRDLKPPLSPGAADTAQWIDNNFHAGWITARAARRGVGMHHGGVPRSLQQQMVRLFNEGSLKFLICTSTLIEGVNTAAESVIIYDRRKSRNVLDFFTYKNIQGRAGRMGKYFIGKVFVLERPPEDEEFTVEYAVDEQNSETPLSLIMQLDDKDLSDGSRDRVAEELKKGQILSEATLRLNSKVPVETQEAIARDIIANENRETLYGWSQFPRERALPATCELIVKHLSGKLLADYGIVSGAQLAWHLTTFSTAKQIVRGYLDNIVRGLQAGQSISEAIDVALKIMRNVISYRFPQDLMTIHNIQRDVFQTLEIRPGDYTVYAEQAEHYFLPSTLAALEEYGVPLQVVWKLAANLAPHYEFDEVLGRLRTLDLPNLDLTPFEKTLLAQVQDGL